MPAATELTRAPSPLARTRALVDHLPLEAVRPWHVLLLLVVVQWAAVALFAVTVRHNGWLYYQGGDQIFHYTDGWLLGHRQLGPTPISYQWPVLLAPLARIAGPSFVAGLPVIVLFNVVLLLPAALLCIYSLGKSLGGARFGLIAAGLWVVLPWLGVRYADAGYHAKFTEQFLPQALGLTAMVDFPALIALLVSATFTVRAFQTSNCADGALAGLAAGVAVGFKASNFIFLPVPLVVLAVARRWRQLLPFALATVPALATLAFWKERGLGYLPAFSESGVHLASGTTVGLLGPAHRYVHLDWNHLYNSIVGIKEHFWSVRLVEWVPLAGLIALARRSRTLLLFFGGWFFAYMIIKGTYDLANVEDGSFFRFLMPAFPPFLIMCAALPLLVPGLAQRVRAPHVRELPAPAARIAVAVGLVVFGIVPFATVAIAKPIHAPTTNSTEYIQNLTPVSKELGLTVARTADGNALQWRSPAHLRAAVFYDVLRAPAGNDQTCTTTTGADVCQLQDSLLATTRSTSFVDRTPGSWMYRVGVSANWLNDVHFGDVILLSPPASPGG